MKKISSSIDPFARIRVIGVGGSGGNAINHMIKNKVQGVDFVAINTDSQDLKKSKADVKVNIGKKTTHGLGTGMNPELGKRAAEESVDAIEDVIKGSDMVFIACGMGGGTGTGAAPVVAKKAKDLGILSVAIVTLPFSFEGKVRARFAEQGIESLAHEVDAYVIIPNDRIFDIIDEKTSIGNAFANCDNILLHAVSGISDLITSQGIINVDFADVKTVLEDAGTSLLGIGTAKGAERAITAAERAISSPLIEASIEGARRIIFSVAANGDDIQMGEVQKIAEVVTNSIDENAKVVFGTRRDSSLRKGELQVTIIASGSQGKRFGLPGFSSSVRQTPKAPDDDVIHIGENGVVTTEMEKGKGDESRDEKNEEDSPWKSAFFGKKK